MRIFFDENSMRKNKICCYCNISMTNIGTHTHSAKAQWKNFFFLKQKRIQNIMPFNNFKEIQTRTKIKQKTINAAR